MLYITLRATPDVSGMFEDSDPDSHSLGSSEGSATGIEKRGYGRKTSLGSDESVGSGGNSSLFKVRTTQGTL